MTNKTKKSQVRHSKGGNIGTNNLSLDYCGFRVITHLADYVGDYTDTKVFWYKYDK